MTSLPPRTWLNYQSGSLGTSPGVGSLDFRFEIEGMRHQFVTNESMVTASLPYYSRLIGLKRENLRISYNTDIVTAIIDGQPLTAVIQGNDAVTDAFGSPSKQVSLVQTISDSDTTIPVTSVDGWSIGEDLHLGTERMPITSIVTGANPSFTVNRLPAYERLSRYHYVNASASFSTTNNRTITDRPATLLKRRAYLYAYGPDDNPVDTGSMVWRGVLASDVSCNGDLDYRLDCRPITDLLKTNIGQKLADIPARGIYHPAAFPLNIFLAQMVNNQIVSGAYTVAFSGSVSGFYSTKEEMAAAMNTQMAVTCSLANGWNTIPRLGFLDDGTMAIYFTTDNNALALFGGFSNGIHDYDHPSRTWKLIPEETNTYTDYMQLAAGAPRIGGIVQPLTIPLVAYNLGTGVPGSPSTTRVPVTSVVANHNYCFAAQAPYPNVLGVCVAPYATPLPAGTPSFYDTTNPANRVYLNLPGALPADVNQISTETTADAGSGGSTSTTGAPRSIVFNNPGTDATLAAFSGSFQEVYDFVIRDDDHKFKIGVQVCNSASMWTFLTSLTQLAPKYSTLGTIPPLFPPDVDLAGISGSLSQSNPSPYVISRRYGWAGDAKKLEDVLAEEFKLAGCVPSITSDGRIGIQRLRFASVNELANASVGQSQLLTDREPFLPFSYNASGIKNVVKLKTGYDFAQDDWTGQTVTALFAQSIESLGGIQQVQEIAPYSNATVVLTRDEVQDVVLRPLALLGLRYGVTSFEVPLSYYTRIALGSVVNLTNPNIPNLTARTRGVSNLPGIVIGVDWDLSQGRGRINLLTSDITWRGYTPSLLCASTTSLGGNLYSLACSRSMYAPTGYQDDQYFNVGDAVVLEEFNMWNPRRVDATVTAVDLVNSAVTVGVTGSIPGQFGWAPNTGIRVRYQNLTASYGNPSQKTWAYVASGSTLGFAAGPGVTASYFSG